MVEPLTPAARALLGRVIRSLAPWRVRALLAADESAMRELVARGLVEQHLGIYRPTAAGRAAPHAPSL